MPAVGRNGGGTAATKLAEQWALRPRYSDQILRNRLRIRVPRVAAYLVILITLIVMFGVWVTRSTEPDDGRLALKHYFSNMSVSMSRTPESGERTSVQLESRAEASDVVIDFELLDELTGNWNPLDPAFTAGVELNGQESRASLRANGRCEARIPLARFKLQGRANDFRIWVRDPAGRPFFSEHTTSLSFRDSKSWFPW